MYVAGESSSFIILADRPDIRAQWPDWTEFTRIRALHEFGHSLGLVDQYKTDEGIMYAFDNRTATHITSSDLALFQD